MTPTAARPAPRLALRTSLLQLQEEAWALSHPDGGSKARFFLSKGYSARRPQRLMWDLRRLAQGGRVTQVVPSEHGTKYLVEGELEAPKGGSFPLRTLGIIRAAEEHPRFVTAYPVTPGS